MTASPLYHTGEDTEESTEWRKSHVMNDAKELVQYHESERNHILPILKRTYKMAELLLEKPVESVTESDMQTLYG